MPQPISPLCLHGIQLSPLLQAIQDAETMSGFSHAQIHQKNNHVVQSRPDLEGPYRVMGQFTLPLQNSAIKGKKLKWV